MSAPRVLTVSTTFDEGMSITVAKPAGTVEEDLLAAVITVQNGANIGITPPSGWTLVRRQNEFTDAGLAVFFKRAGPSEPADYTWTFDNTDKWCAGIARIVGVSTDPVDVDAGAAAGPLWSGAATTAPRLAS